MNRLTRTLLAGAATVGLLAGAAGIAGADTITELDANATKTSPHLQYQDSANTSHEACSSRGTAVAGDGNVHGANTGDSFANGEQIVITGAPTEGQAGITIVGDTVQAPATWDRTGDTRTDLPFELSTTVLASVPDGTYQVTITATGQTSGKQATATFNVGIDCEGEPVDLCAGRTAPATAPIVTLNPASPNGSNDWYNTTAPTFTVSPATDAEYSLDDGTTWTAYTAAVTLADGQHDVTARNFLPATTTPACPRLDGPASTSQHVMVDTVNPSVAITSPDDLSNTVVGSVDVAGTFSDATSGVASITVNGQAATLNRTAGTFSRSALALACGGNTITAVATDNAGNTNSDSVSVYRRCFTGAFQQPLDPNGVLNKAKLGRVVPVKLTITANDGGSVPTPVYFGYRQLPCSTGAASDAVEEYLAAGSSNTGNTFRLSDGVWIYNLDTSKLPGAAVGKCYQLDVYVGGGTVTTSGIASGGVAVSNGSVRIELTK